MIISISNQSLIESSKPRAPVQRQMLSSALKPNTTACLNHHHSNGFNTIQRIKGTDFATQMALSAYAHAGPKAQNPLAGFHVCV